ncbi:MAG: phosphatidylserine decarboxylase [Nitrospinae bacterium RIFCSPLOWO2_02_FULL_39_110]|nr:MAG: phosphatidylserine decarboxylase [Nitrospinae bacterium RIFCSPHIGHO2_12_FULL_39_42]OGW02882.1 MAG: phosphatidylserine decarboxylase [Nitrospinae bacterium RIFCSPLOWO2_02_39_17]OGW05886.1 MAG: phosphatidylserine decarboxylase [Nitrospinae bacterium RIFCSPLOWO2_02_FULL_39_110]OGW11430.1 MAG: phosphatidylserine decarboxylase [Nitrospinae bacterium RIFCSPLOWO2_12_FULL_39_93]
MRISIVSDGFRFIIPLLILSAIVIYFKFLILSIVLSILTIFIISFFRDPERKILEGKGIVVSPADGRVVKIQTVKDDTIYGGDAVCISIFLSIFNVHVNRAPYEGVIKKVVYNHGKFLAAFDDKASLLNEQNSILIESKNGKKILVKQIAGLIARRIVCWVKEGDKVERGLRYGLIRFGSRVDIFLPPDTELKVKVGDKIKGGIDVIGRLR